MRNWWLYGIVITLGACAGGTSSTGVDNAAVTGAPAAPGARALPSCGGQLRPTGVITVDETPAHGLLTVLVDGVPLCTESPAEFANGMFGGAAPLPMDVPVPLSDDGNSDPMPADGEHPTNSDPMPARGK